MSDEGGLFEYPAERFFLIPDVQAIEVPLWAYIVFPQPARGLLWGSSEGIQPLQSNSYRPFLPRRRHQIAWLRINGMT
jgi:hypothetical protein